MAHRRSRGETWFVVIVGVVCVLLGLVFGLPQYMKYSATILHPEPQKAPAVKHADPAHKWAPAVERARQVIRGGLSEQNLPGLSVAVGVGGDIVWAEGFGWADLEKRQSVTPDTRFRVGTASMALTSAGVGRLLEAKRLKLDEAIQTYVPQFPKKQWPVTLRQVMGHIAGVRSDSGDEGPLFSQRCVRPVEALPFFAEFELTFEPGTQYRKSKYGWILVSAAVEAAAEAPFLTFMQKQIFEPLGMRDTVTESPGKEAPNAAKFYFPRFGADPRYGLHDMRELELSCYAGSMAFLSTPSDLVRFGLAMNNGTLLQRETVRTLQTRQKLSSGKETDYGLGWELKTVTLAGEPVQVAGHDGDSLGGKVVSLLTFRERGIVVVVASNISYADTFSLALKVAEAFAVEEAGRK